MDKNRPFFLLTHVRLRRLIPAFLVLMTLLSAQACSMGGYTHTMIKPRKRSIFYNPAKKHRSKMPMRTRRVKMKPE